MSSDKHHPFYPEDVEQELYTQSDDPEQAPITDHVYKLSDLTIPIPGWFHKAISFRQNDNANGENLNKLVMISMAVNAEILKMAAKIQFEHDSGVKVPKRRKRK